MRLCVYVLGLLLGCFSPLTTTAQVTDTLAAQPSDTLMTPRIGLVLGGGGARGLAHIGVLKVLEEAQVPIDLLVGTSMGSVVGALYASGYDAEAIEALVLAQDWEALFPLNGQALRRGTNPTIDERFIVHVPLRGAKIAFPLHLMNQQPIYRLLGRVLAPHAPIDDFANLAIPYGAVATNLATGEPTLFTEGNILHAVLASMSLPGLLSPISINDTLYIDGGVARNLPVPEAKLMGADLTVAVYTGADEAPKAAVDSFTDVASETLRLWRRRNAVEQFNQADLLIQPDLGNHSAASFQDIEAIIAQGEAAARAALPHFEALLANHRIQPREAHTTPQPQQMLVVDHISVDGLRGRRARALLRYLHLQPNATYSIQALEDAMDKGYATERFSHLYYSLTPSDATDALHLTVHAQTHHNEWLAASVHYDTEFALSALFAMRLHLPLGTWFEAHARVGELVHAQLTYHIPLPSRFLDTFYIRGAALRLPYRVYTDSLLQNQHRLTQGERTFDRFMASAGFAFDLGHRTTLNMAFLGEYNRLNEGEQEALFWTFQADLRRDGLNALDFPTRGTLLRLHTNQHVLSEFYGTDTFIDALPSQLMGRFTGYLPLTSFASVYTDLAAGNADVFAKRPTLSDTLTGPQRLPLLPRTAIEDYYWGGSFFVGGFPDYAPFSERHFALPGAGIHAFSGSGFATAALGVRFHVVGPLFASAEWTYAFLENHNRLHREFESLSASVGLRTPLGPLRLTFAEALRGFNTTYPVHFSIGHTF